MLPKKLEFILMRKITIKWVMNLLIANVAKKIGTLDLANGPSLFVDDKNKKQHVENLNKNGCTVLDKKLSADAVNEIISYTESIKCYDPYHNENTPVDIKKPPLEAHLAHFKRNDLLRFKPILDIANDPSILQVVQDFLGAKPTISNVNMWWSFGGRKQAEHAQLYHRDLDDWKFCKLFIYLTDVTAKAGPHIYVKGSSRSPKYRRIRRYSDSEIESAFGKENVLKFIDTKGAAFIVDTYGFHKGLLPESEDRLLLQVQYSLGPIGIEVYEPLKIDQMNYNPYINRLMVK